MKKEKQNGEKLILQVYVLMNFELNFTYIGYLLILFIQSI